MTIEEAQKVFKAWQEYVEIADKLQQVFAVIPESFLPYPKGILAEALNTTAKSYFDAGNRRMSDNILNSMAAWLTCAKEDDEAIAAMKKELDLRLGNPDLRKATIEALRRTQESWARSK
jgi:hypothetical protein